MWNPWQVRNLERKDTDEADLLSQPLRAQKKRQSLKRNTGRTFAAGGRIYKLLQSASKEKDNE
jgi:hypothetical protein